jgi:hypothetical protein
MSACGAERGPVSPSGVAAPSLIAPAENAYIRQNDPATGCANDPVWGHGFKVTFSWEPVQGASGYRIWMKHPSASVPVLDEAVPGPTYEFLRCTTAMGVLESWDWKVQAIGADGAESGWSATRKLNFTSCRIGDVGCGDQSLR